MSLWRHIENHIADTLGESVHLSRPDSVAGGCINQAFRVHSDGLSFFVKTNDASGLDMFAAEAEGLEELGGATGLCIPGPVCFGVAEGHAYLVMDDLQLGGRADQRALGEALANMHRTTADSFGWHRDNTIGATPQINTPTSDWISFWHDHRLGYQLRLAQRKGTATQLQKTGEQLLAALPALLDGHEPKASLLHGDLWSGNYAFTRHGQPALFDPAVYYGDRETDLAMTELFGGFGQDFYAAYDNSWPLDSGYPVRKKLYNLYHVLNHFNLFGGGYLSQAQGMMQSLLGEVR